MDEAEELEGVAIIGMSGRFPGAKNVQQFWNNLVAGVDCISRFTAEEVEYSVLTPESKARGKKSVSARGVLDDVDLFDAAFFGIYPKEAEIMDPQHRIFLECCWESLESAGYDPQKYPGMIGVFAGVSLNTYLLHNLCADGKFAGKLAGNYQVGEYQAMMGNDKDFMPTRVSYKLNLRGPSMAIQTACSSSLVAISQACSSLSSYQSDMILAGGVSITFPQRRDYFYEEDGMASVDGTCRTFDADAKGTVFGHGCAVVLLKRLSDAVKDRDNILAVIKGTAINNDGSEKIGYAAPSVNSQAEVIAMAQAAADVTPDSISYIEAHGTGTPLGDPIEIAALTKAFRDGGATENGFCAIATGKPNISHLDVAAGATGLIKTVMQLQNSQIPPLLHYKAPNPKIDFANSPFFPVTNLREWKRGAEPRRAGISAFGVGGTNAHIIVEEAPIKTRAASNATLTNVFPLSAKSESALANMRQNLADYLSAHPELDLSDVAHTLQIGRRSFDHRSIVVASNREKLIHSLKADFGSAVTGKASAKEPEVVFLFPGQGAQYVDMGRELYERQPVFRKELDCCAEILKRHLGQDLRKVLYPNEHDDSAAATNKIDDTSIAQPAIFAVEYALAKLWMSWGIQPSVLIGHSIGEYVCAVLAGTFSLEDALALLSVRAQLMGGLPGGSMLGVRLSAEEVEPMLPSEVSVAAANSPKLCTLSGPTTVLESFRAELEGKRIACRMLATSHAFHSAAMDPILPEFFQASEKTKRQPPKIRWISTCSGKEMTGAEIADAAYWSRQLRQTVRFADALDTLFVNPGEFVLVEVGPGRALNQIVRQHPANIARNRIVATLGQPENGESDLQSAFTALGKLWIEGIQPEWDTLHADQQSYRVALPTYPFERKRFWVEPQKRMDDSSSTSSVETETACSSSLETCSCAESPLRENVAGTGVANVQPLAIHAQSATGTQLSRKDKIAKELRTIFLNLSGTAIEDDHAAFIDLGFDSLFLSQASQAIDACFKIKITFRQLLGDLSTVAAITTLLDTKLPSEMFSESEMPVAATNVASLTTPSSSESAANLQGSTGSGQLMPALGQNGSDIERLLTGHIQNLQVLLERNRQQAIASPASIHSSSSLRTVRKPGGAVVTSSRKPEETKRFGPYKPIEKGEKGGLTAIQEDGLNRLIARYVKKTLSSKKYTAEHRPHFADPRAVAGFRSQWKDMVYPIVSARSKGSKIWDVDGNEYVDITMGFGTYFFGHSPDWLIAAIQEQLHIGIEIGPQSPLAGKVAKMIAELTGLDRVTFCNTGSEAVMAAMRLARTVTGRNRIVYFTGDYHGMFEEVLVRGAWPNGEYRAQPIAPGIPPSLVENILVLEYGAPESLEIIKLHADEIAAVMVEPVQSRNPSLQPREFLHQLRQVTEDLGAALIFDEVVTGFRCHQGGAQAYFGVKADMATYGKVVGGGMPIGILAGIPKFMDALDGGMWQYGDDSFPEVGVTFFAGTFVRHPLAIAAAHAVLNFLKESGPELQTKMTARVENVCKSINEAMELAQVPIRMSSFSAFAAIDYAPDLKFASLLWYYLREKGIHIWEGRPCYFTLAHSDQDLNRFIGAFKESVAEMQADGFLPKKDLVGSVALPTSNASQPSKNAISLENSNGRFPLAEGQREMWLGAQMSPDAARPHYACNYFVLEGPFNLAAMREAFASVVDRHVGLRCTFSADGTEVLVQPNFALAVPLIDLSELPEQEQRQRFAEILDEESHRLFDLSSGPLIAVQIVKLSETRHQLIVIAQMIVCDGWSHYVLFEELSEIYSAICEGRSPVLREVVPMQAYAEWQAKYWGTSEANDCEKYWRSQFKEVPSPLELPTKGQRPLSRTVDADRRDLLLSAEFYEEIKRFGKLKKNSSFAVLLAAFQVWLHRLSGERDLVIGVPFSEQSSLGFHTLVGQCANTLPIRTKLDPKENFPNFLSKTWNQLLDAQENAHFTFGRLIQHLEIPHDPSRIPLVSVIFNIDPAMAKVKFTGLKHHFSAGPRFYYQFDLGFNLVEEEDGLRVECDFNTNLFDADIIQDWLSSYETLLRQVLKDGNQSIAELPMVQNVNEAVLIGPSLAIDPKVTVHQLILDQVSRTPNAVAITQADNNITYAQLDRFSNHLACELQRISRGTVMEFARIPSTAGIQANAATGNSTSRVGILVASPADLVIAGLAVFKSGCTCVPIYPELPSEQIEHIVKDGELCAILTTQSLGKTVASESCPVVFMPDNWQMISEAGSPKPLEVASDQIAFVLYKPCASGTRRSVEVTHHTVVNSLLSLQGELRLNESDSMLGLSPWTTMVSIQIALLPLTVGGRCISTDFTTFKNSDSAINRIAAPGISVLHATPTLLRRLLGAGWKGESDLRILVDGEPLDVALANRLLTNCREAWYLCGPSDGTTWFFFKRLQPNHKLTLDRPLSNTSVSVADENLRAVPKGVPGFLLIAGPVGQTILRSDDCFMRRDDNQLEWHGRCEDQVMLQGHSFDVSAIEDSFRAHNDVIASTVVLRDDLNGEPGLVAYVFVKKDKLATLDRKQMTGELRKSIRCQLPPVMVPKHFVYLSDIPMNLAGVLDRAALPAPTIISEEVFDDYVAPTNPSQEKMAIIWQEILRVPSVGMDDNFFELGGQSLLAVKLFQRIESGFGRRLPLATLFQAPTIARLTAILDDRTPSQSVGWQSLITIQSQGSQKPLFLVHGAGGNVLLYHTLAKYLAPEQPLYGLQSQGLDGESQPLHTIEEMAERYLSEIRSVQPTGPYYLGGYCLGGTVAYEMAQRLTSDGESVGMVAMLDTYNFSRALKSSFWGFLIQKLRFHLGNFVGLRPRHMLHYIKEKFRVARDGEFANLLTSRPGFETEQGAARATSGAEATVQTINDTAAETYIPKPYAGTLTLFKPRINYKFYPDPKMGWGDLAADLDIVEFPFNPHAMLLEPYVEQLAQSLLKKMSSENSLQNRIEASGGDKPAKKRRELVAS